MADTASDILVGRAPTSPCDFYVVDAAVPSGVFTRKVVGSVTTFLAALEANADVAATGTSGYATAIRAVVSTASGATVSNVIPLSIETYATDAPTGLHAMMRFNTSAALDTPDVWFTSNKQAVAYEIGTGSSAVRGGGIKVKITGANLLNSANGYIHVYQDNT